MTIRENRQFFVGWLLFSLHALGMIAVWVAGLAYEWNAQANGVWTEGGWILMLFVAHLLAYGILLAGCILMMTAIRKKGEPVLPAALPRLIRLSYFRIPLQWILLQATGIGDSWLPGGVLTFLSYAPLLVMLLTDLLNLVLACVLALRFQKRTPA